MTSRSTALKRKANLKIGPLVKKIGPNKIGEEEDDENNVKTKPYKNMCNDDFSVKTPIYDTIEDKKPNALYPKIKIRCEPLNVEKIIDFENNTVIVNKVNEIKPQPKKKRRKIPTIKTVTQKSSGSKSLIKFDKNSNRSQLKNSKSLRTPRKRLGVSTKKLTASSVGNLKKNTQISFDKTQILLENKSQCFGCVQPANNGQLNLPVSTSQITEELSSENLSVETVNNQMYPNCPSVNNLGNKSVLIELSEINLREFNKSLGKTSNEELKMKLKERENDLNKNIEDDVIVSNVTKNCYNSTVVSDKSQCTLDQVNYLKKTSLQVVVESFMRNPQLNYLKENNALKKGLCFTWLSNNYKCSNQQCLYNHNAFNLFTNKLKKYPSKFIMTIVVSMRNDTLFVDVIMAAFKILSGRQIPVVWVTFLIYFVFYVTEPSDSRFLKFWANSARFFCQANETYAAARGFASLISIFSEGDTSEEWKIVEFIKLIKEPPVQVPVNFALLQPVLKINLPSQFLIEAVESSIATQKDLLKVYSMIIPKISIMTSPVQVVELLLKFCQTLEENNQKSYSNDLKRRLEKKVLTFKTKIALKEYPLTAFFQEEIAAFLKEGNDFAAYDFFPEEIAIMDLDTLSPEYNYFKLGDDFCSLMTEAMEVSSDLIPSPYRNELMSKSLKNNNNNSKENICERQVTRIKQFFRDSQFDSLAKYLNELRPNVTERAAEEFVKLSFQMKISLQQVVDLIKIIVLPCKTENATKVIASVSITLILNLVRINEWEKAHTIASLCHEKEINLVAGKVFYFSELNAVTQCRIALLLIEIYAYKSDYVNAIGMVKKYNLFSSNNSLWSLTWKDHDETIRVRILEDLLQQIISNQVTDSAFDLFQLIWKEQSKLFGAIDLRKFVNEILVLLLNQDSENAIDLYEKTKTEVQLKGTTVRAILVTLVRSNSFSSAKDLLISVNQNIYVLPEIKLNPVTVTILSFWLEEEIYAVFDAFFDLLSTKKQNFFTTNGNEFDVQIHISEPDSAHCSILRPLCLGIIKSSFKDACTRIQRVFQYQFNPPLKLIVKPYSLKLDEHSVQLHLSKRIRSNYPKSFS